MENFEPELNPEITHPELGAEIIKMADEDQRIRLAFDDITDEDENKENGKRMVEADERNTARMKEIVDEYGWPTIPMVGEKAAGMAWLLVQHADRDPDFQQRALELMEAELEKGTVKPRNVAYLTDRVRVNFERPQVFGTQWWPGESGLGEPRPIEDPEHLDERRAAYGMSPYREYEASMQEVFAKDRERKQGWVGK